MSEHAGHRSRLRTRFRQEGLSGFAEHEVLELLLTYAIPRVDTNPLAHQLIRRFGSLRGVLEAPAEELEQVNGIGENAAALITMLLPVFRMYEQQKLLPRKKLDTYAALAAYCRALFIGAVNEELYLLSFDARLQLLSTTLISRGTPAEVAANPRLIMQELIRHNAVNAVLTHNHPSESSFPSQEDVNMTLEIQSVLRGVGIRLVDHIMIAGMQDYSILRGIDSGFETSSPPTLAADRPQQLLNKKR